MKKKLLISAVLLFGFLLLICFALDNRGWCRCSYGVTCVKCLAEKNGLEKTLFGFVWSNAESVPTEGRCYETVMGETCQHEFKRMGCCREYGLFRTRSVACGSFSDGVLFRYRVEALTSAYDAFERTGARDLAISTYKLIDEILPLNAKPGASSYSSCNFVILISLPKKLPAVGSPQEWAALMEQIENERKANEGR